MTTLETEFKTNGFDFRQIERQGDVAIYEQSKGGRVLTYELIIVQKHPAETIKGRPYPEREGYPYNEQWGSQAWTVMNLDDARQRLRNLVAQP